MPRVYDRTDLLWSSRGDFEIGHDGDLLDTKNDPLRSLVQEIKTRIESDVGEWRVFPSIGSGINDFVGQPNNKITAENIKVRIIGALTRNGFISSSDIKVIYLPFAIDKIVFRVSIRVSPTPENINSTEIVVHSLYNYKENNVSYIL